MNSFSLPNWNTLTVEETDREHVIQVEYAVGPARCPHCDSVADHTRFGRRQQRFRDLPAYGKPVSILVRRRRCLCKSCGRTFLESLPDMDEHHRMTRRLVAYIVREALTRSFVSIAAEVGLSEGSIRNIQRAPAEHTAVDLAAEVGGSENGDFNT